MSYARFRHRPKRIARREERNKFAFIVMPLTWITSVIGLAVMLGVFLYYGTNSELHIGALGAGAILTLMPAVVTVVRFVRGHYHDALDEP